MSEQKRQDPSMDAPSQPDTNPSDTDPSDTDPSDTDRPDTGPRDADARGASGRGTSDGWQANLITADDEIAALLRAAKRVAVIGIKGADRSGEPAYSVSRYLQTSGYEIIPVNPTIDDALGAPSLDDVTQVDGAVDIVNIFRRPENIPAHAREVLAMDPPPTAVWLQLGIANDEAAETLAKAGIKVVQNRCIAVEHRRLVDEG